MRFVLYGAGAVGGLIGGRLHQHGHDVVLIARGAHHDAIAARGLLIRSPAEEVTLRMRVVDHPRRLTFGPDDVVLMSMKTQDTGAALQELVGHAPPDIPIVCVQNGVENERLALRRFTRVHGVVVICPTAHLEPGLVQSFASPGGILDIGRYPQGTDDVARSIAEHIESAGLLSIPRTDIMRWKYRKLIGNLGNAVEAVCGPDARAGAIGDAARQEGEACLRAAEIDYVSVQEWRDRHGLLVGCRRDAAAPGRRRRRGARRARLPGR